MGPPCGLSKCEFILSIRLGCHEEELLETLPRELLDRTLGEKMKGQLNATAVVSSSHLSSHHIGPPPGYVLSSHISLQLHKQDQDIYKCLFTWKSDSLNLSGTESCYLVTYQVSPMTIAQGNS